MPVVNAVARTFCAKLVRLPGVADEGRDRLRGGRLRGDRRQDGEDGERKGHGDWGARHAARGRGKLCEGWEPGWRRGALGETSVGAGIVERRRGSLAVPISVVFVSIVPPKPGSSKASPAGFRKQRIPPVARRRRPFPSGAPPSAEAVRVNRASEWMASSNRPASADAAGITPVLHAALFGVFMPSTFFAFRSPPRWARSGAADTPARGVPERIAAAHARSGS